MSVSVRIRRRVVVSARLRVSLALILGFGM